MGWIGAIILIFIILYFIGSSQPKTKGSSPTTRDSTSNQAIEEAAQEIADKIKTPRGADGLEDRIDKAQLRLYDLETDKTIANQERKIEILDRALEIIEQKVFAYQYTPYLSLLTPAEKIEKAFKKFSVEEYQELVESFDPKQAHWSELDRYMDYEEVDNSTKGLKKFRQIYDSDIDENEKWKKIKQLISSNEELKEEYFYDPDISPKDHFEMARLKEQGIPFVDMLFPEGFKVLDDYLNLDPVEFIKKKGIGPAKQKQLIEFQQNIKPL